MRRRWPVAVLAVGGGVLLASLYLPWLDASPPGGSLLNLFTFTIDGWDSRLGDAAALSDVLLIALAVVMLVKPSVGPRLPLSGAALLAFYLAVGVGVQARTVADVNERVRNVHYQYVFGAYLGIAAAALILLAAAALWDDRPSEDTPVLPLVVASLLACALLVALALPWIGLGNAVAVERGVVVPPGTVAAACSVWFLVGCWSGRSNPASRLALAAAAALFTGAAFAASSASTLEYGAWFGLASALALLAVALLAEARRVHLRRPADRQLVAAGGTALFVVSLFLAWQTYHLPPSLGLSSSFDGWTLVGTAAAALALLFVAGAESYAFETAAGVAVLVATAGFEVTGLEEPDLRIDISYGAKLGFAAAARSSSWRRWQGSGRESSTGPCCSRRSRSVSPTSWSSCCRGGACCPTEHGRTSVSPGRRG